MGPTAAGKTAAALRLAERFPVAIISVDSAQVYRGLDIGTAKPGAEELQRAPHALLDLRDPHEVYSAGEFCRDAAAAMRAARDQGRIPLLAGGTMLYFHALQNGLAELPPADPALRAELDGRAAAEGWGSLHAELADLDPITAARLQPTDAQRIQRALEVCLLSGEAMSDLQAETAPVLAAEYLNIGLLPTDRAQLHARIEARFDSMLAAGFVEEVKRIAAMPAVTERSPAMRAVGYRQYRDCLMGNLDPEQAREKAIVATRRLAKRQLTWLRSWPDLHVVDCFAADSTDQVEKLTADWLKA